MTETSVEGYSRRLSWRKAAALLALLAAAGVVTYFLSRPNVGDDLQRAQSASERGNYQRALDIAEDVLARTADDPEALVIAGDACFALAEYDRALSYYRRVPPGESKLSIHAHLRCGRIEMHHVGNAVAAEAHFLEALRHVPDDKNALFQLASILGIEGRRQEAVPVILRWFRLGGFHRDLLTLIRVENSALYNLKELHRYRDASPENPAILTGLAWHARQSGRTDEAVSLLERALDLAPGFAEARVALASLLWDTQKFDALQALLIEKRSRDIDDARLWIIRGNMAKHGGQTAVATRCFWEAWRRDPTNRTVTYEIFRYLSEKNEHQSAEAFRRRIEELQQLREQTDLVVSKIKPDLAEIRKLVSRLEQIGLLWEAWGWCKVASEMDPNAEWATDRATAIHRTLQQTELTRCALPKDLRVDLSALPLPESYANPVQSVAKLPDATCPVTFRNDAPSAGIAFQYNNSPGKADSGQKMYEFPGGGVAVLDYDNDGWPDLHFTQGCRWPVDATRFEHLDQLYRNQGDGRFLNVTHATGLAENRFSAGVTVGDFDNDGFDDLYIANIGRNRLYRNNGDGTFQDVTQDAGVDDPGWSTSCVMADLNGDSLPDLYSVNYLEGPSIFDKVCRHKDGRPRMCLPFDFPGAQDQLYLNLGDGRFRNVTKTSGVQIPNGKGLGVVAADWEGNGRLGLFVANDTVPNFFFVNRGSHSDGTPRMEERGILAGVSLNGAGNAEGCMGIAVGDVNNDGHLDLYVTNFYQETNTLYLSQTGTAFEDATRRSGLAAPSLAMLGFGTQFLDADLDGRLDLLVTNGHIDDYRPYGRPYKMPPQFFWNRGGTRFDVQSIEKRSPYFTGHYLGRGLARLDWNRDGREDAVITHLDHPAALLTNTTSPHGRALRIRLRGVQSARDAIGTTVTVRSGGDTQVRQLTAGDGYQASNERLLVFGLGSRDTASQIEVRWPSEVKSTFQNIEADAEYLLIEGRDRLYRLRP